MADARNAAGPGRSARPGRVEGVGERFQRETKYGPGRPSDAARATPRPEPFKVHLGATRVTLERPRTAGGLPLWDALQSRRSVRDYSAEPLSATDLSQVLWAAQGVTARVDGVLLRTAPSAGALNPVETYVLAHRVEGLPPGIYHYDARDHALELLVEGDVRGEASAAALEQSFVADAAAVLAWTAVFERCARKYGQRAYRYVYLDAGQIAENAALAAVSLGLASCPVAAFHDDAINGMLGVDGTAEGVLYMTALGAPAEEPGRDRAA